MNANTFIPPGSTSQIHHPVVDARTSLGDRFRNPETIKARISKIRMQDDQRKKLTDEFAVIDLNKDGFISRVELHEFFKARVSTYKDKLTKFCRCRESMIWNIVRLSLTKFSSNVMKTMMVLYLCKYTNKSCYLVHC